MIYRAVNQAETKAESKHHIIVKLARYVPISPMKIVDIGDS